MIYVADTNIFIDQMELLEGRQVVVLSHVLRELEKHKGLAKSENPDKRELAFKARRATRVIYEKVLAGEYLSDMTDYTWDAEDPYESGYVDNMIIKACLVKGYGLITKDTLLALKAQGFGIELVFIEDDSKTKDTGYTGFVEVKVNGDKELAELYEDNALDLLTNQYMVVDFNGDIHCTRWDGSAHVDVHLPPQKVAVPKNAHQAIALDLLWNKDIPIKFVTGTYGSGKTFLSSKVAIEYIIGTNKTRSAAKLMMVRNPIGAGEQIGFLKGTKEDKTQDFFKPIVQHLNPYQVAELEGEGRLLKEIPFYMKGLSIDNTFIIVDEAEDLNLKLIKLIGTRLGQKSNVVFSGDFNQAEDKYVYNNGLYIAIDKLKGNPLVGVVCLQEDVRSDASKVFADL